MSLSIWDCLLASWYFSVTITFSFTFPLYSSLRLWDRPCSPTSSWGATSSRATTLAWSSRTCRWTGWAVDFEFFNWESRVVGLSWTLTKGKKKPFLDARWKNRTNTTGYGTQINLTLPFKSLDITNPITRYDDAMVGVANAISSTQLQKQYDVPPFVLQVFHKSVLFAILSHWFMPESVAIHKLGQTIFPEMAAFDLVEIQSNWER